MIRRTARNDITDHLDRAENTEPIEPNDPIENADAIEPTEPIDRTLPTDPIDSTEPLEPIDSTEYSDHNDRRLVDRFGSRITPACPVGDLSGNATIGEGTARPRRR